MITLAQLYDLGLAENVDIFSGLQLPAGSPMSRDIMVNSIIERCGLNIPLYADVPVMKSAIQVWSAKHQYTFKHIAKIYEATYSPIENTDRYEDITVSHDRDLTDMKVDKTSDKNTDNITNREILTTNGSKTESGSVGVTENKKETHSGTDTTTETAEVSAYNASTYQSDNKVTTGLQHGEIISNTNGASTTSSGSESTSGDSTKASDGRNTSNRDINRTADQKVEENETTRTINHTHGNIGVMDNATMQEKEYELLNGFNPYNFISELFENELTVFVY